MQNNANVLLKTGNSQQYVLINKHSEINTTIPNCCSFFNKEGTIIYALNSTMKGQQRRYIHGKEKTRVGTHVSQGAHVKHAAGKVTQKRVRSHCRSPAYLMSSCYTYNSSYSSCPVWLLRSRTICCKYWVLNIILQN